MLHIWDICFGKNWCNQTKLKDWTETQILLLTMWFFIDLVSIFVENVKISMYNETNVNARQTCLVLIDCVIIVLVCCSVIVTGISHTGLCIELIFQGWQPVLSHKHKGNDKTISNKIPINHMKFKMESTNIWKLFPNCQWQHLAYGAAVPSQ